MTAILFISEMGRENLLENTIDHKSAIISPSDETMMINSNNYVVFVFYILKYLGGGHFIIERGAFHRLSAFDQNVLFAPFKVFGQKIGVCRNID